MILKEICAFDRGYECSALVHKQCQDCPFYKTIEQLEQGRKASIERLIRLDNLEYYIYKYTLKLGGD